MTAEQAAALRAPFPPEMIGKLPRSTKKDNPRGRCEECGGYHGLPAVHLDYVGHAAITDRLLQVDPEWTWEPLARDAQGLPLRDASGGMWIALTVAGVTRLGYGDETNGKGVKEVIGDALRNGAMRFGVGLDLWSKENLLNGHEAHEDAPGSKSQVPESTDKGPVEKTQNRPRNRGEDTAAGMAGLQQAAEEVSLTFDELRRWTKAFFRKNLGDLSVGELVRTTRAVSSGEVTDWLIKEFDRPAEDQQREESSYDQLPTAFDG